MTWPSRLVNKIYVSQVVWNFQLKYWGEYITGTQITTATWVYDKVSMGSSVKESRGNPTSQTKYEGGEGEKHHHLPVRIQSKTQHRTDLKNYSVSWFLHESFHLEHIWTSMLFDFLFTSVPLNHYNISTTDILNTVTIAKEFCLMCQGASRRTSWGIE